MLALLLLVAACEGVPPPVLPASLVPTDEQRDALKGCVSQDLYYGIGAAADFDAAARCAAIEWEHHDSDVLSGSGILFMIFANGRGVPRDLTLARGFACEQNREEWLKALADLEAGRIASVESCAGVLDNVSQIECATLADDAAALRRAARRDAALQALSPENRELAEAALAAAEDFDSAHLEIEFLMGGAAAGVASVAEHAADEESCVALLEALVKGDAPSGSAGEFADADAELNRSYRAALKRARGNGRAADAEGIRQTELAWIASRDAWLRLVRAIDAAHADAWATELTRARIAQLMHVG